MSDLISRQTIVEIIQSMYPGMPRVPWMIKNWKKQYEPYIRVEKEIKGLPSAQTVLSLTCNGCKYVGTYDIDFPCSGCIRREKDYYEQE